MPEIPRVLISPSTLRVETPFTQHPATTCTSLLGPPVPLKQPLREVAADPQHRDLERGRDGPSHSLSRSPFR
jgi:hypothetical protein